MIASSRSIKIFLAIAITISFGTNAQGIYSVLDYVGSATDWFMTRGALDEKYEHMFQEIAAKYGITHRGIKIRNSGFFLRLAFGYDNAMANQATNRIYVNQDYLRELTDEEVKYLMAHELAHHHNHDSLNLVIAEILVNKAESYAITSPDPEIKSLIDRYFTEGMKGTFLPRISFWNLIKAQFSQSIETRADTQAVTIAGIDPEAGAHLMEKLYNPETKSWPLYARIDKALSKLKTTIYSLPILKQHASHLTSCKDRIAHILSLKATAMGNTISEKNS